MSAPRMANILVTGTPGTGKTTLAAEVAQATGWEHINIGERVKAEELHHGWDEDFEAWTLDEDKVGCNMRYRVTVVLGVARLLCDRRGGLGP
jgi:broad-specificity NMP kinase